MSHSALAFILMLLTPVAAGLAIAFALRPAWRRALSWPMLVSALAILCLQFWTASVGAEMVARYKAQGRTNLAEAAYGHGNLSGAMMVAAGALLLAALLAVRQVRRTPPDAMPRIVGYAKPFLLMGAAGLVLSLVVVAVSGMGLAHLDQANCAKLA